MKIFPVLVGLVLSRVVRRSEDSQSLPSLLGEKLVQCMSDQELLTKAREHWANVSDEDFMFYFNKLDVNNDSFVDLDEFFTVVEARAREWPTEELIAAELEHLSTVKTALEQTVWGESMDFDAFKLYCALYYVAEQKVFYEEDENGSGDNEWFNYSMSIIEFISEE